MDKQIKLYLPKSESANGEVAQRIKSELEVAHTFAYDSAWGAAKAAVDATADGSVSVVVAEPAQYGLVKMCLFKALSVKILRSSKIKKKIGDKIDPHSDDYNVQTAIPKGAAVFVSFDGLYSSFACPSGEGKIVFVSSDMVRLNEAIEQGVFMDEPDTKAAASARDLLREKIAAVNESGKSVAIANSGNAAKLLTVIKAVGGSEEVFRSVDIEDGDSAVEDAAASMASSARKLSGSDFGAFISSPAQDGSISVCVAGEKAAKVNTVHPVEGEDGNKVTGAAVVTLCDMMLEATKEDIQVPEPEKKDVSKVPLIISIVCLALALILCVVIGVIGLSGRNSQAEDEAAMSETTDDVRYSDDEDFDIYEAGEVSPLHASAYDPFLTSANRIQSTVLGALEATASFAQTTYIAGDAGMSAGDGLTTSPIDYDEGEAPEDTQTTLAPEETSVGSDLTVSTATTVAIGEPGTSAPVTTAQPTGKFILTVYGWGHGVGMSQLGAKTMARQGSTCNEILGHYFPGTVIAVDPNTPKYVTEPDENGNGGMTLLEYLCKTTKQEIGDNAPLEALKAQAVAAYTYAMFNGSFDRGQTIDYNFSYRGTKVEEAVMDILGISSEDEWPHSRYVSYNGTYADTVYCNSMAGKTASARSVWGMKLKYLSGGVSSPEEVEVSTVELTVGEVRNLISDFASSRGLTAEFDKNPAKWIRIISHDGSMSESLGYVNEVKVGGISVNGETFRTKVMKYKVRSHCFTVQYVR
ncbi:MAG: hypothetical protein K6F64_07190 [Clostridia bacterium]|nr:hypothetical protein [Clostridia bacterium]